MEKLNILFRAPTINEETNMVWFVLKEYAWFKNNNYKVILPKHPKIKELIDISLKNNGLAQKYKSAVKEIVKLDYNKEDYQNYLDFLESSKNEIDNLLQPIFEFKKWGFKIHKIYNVILTRYGPGGSYDADKGKIILCTSMKKELLVNATIHEIIHIGIEHFVNKFNLSHSEKERIVDILCSKKLKIDRYHMQKVGDRRIDKFLIRNKFNLPIALEEYTKEVNQIS